MAQRTILLVLAGAWLVTTQATNSGLAIYEDALRQAGLHQQSQGRKLLADGPSPCTAALQCITSQLTGGGLPSFPSQLPDLLLPGGAHLLKLLDIKTLVGYVIMKMQTTSLAGLLSQLGCPSTPLPIFNTSTIATPTFLGALSDGACGHISPAPGPMYIVGALSTKVPDWMSSLPLEWQKKLSEYGRNFSICVAADPCTAAINIGLSGLTADATLAIGDQSLKLSAVNFKSMAYSATSSIGIKKSDVGLWTNDMGAGARPAGPPILGNVAFKFDGGISWAHKVGDKVIADIAFKGQVQAVVNYNNPTRFALQLASFPVLELYGGECKINFKKMAAIFTTKMLFFAEHYSDSNWNVYAGVRLKVKHSDMLNGLDSVISGLIREYVHIPSAANATSVEKAKDVDINVHVNQNGGGVRLFLTGKVTLGSAFQQIQACPKCTVPIQSLVGLGIKFKFMPIQGKLKAFGSVTINHKEYFYTPGCGSNAECPSGQKCYSADTAQSYCSL